jgi:hypothetical protein
LNDNITYIGDWPKLDPITHTSDGKVIYEPQFKQIGVKGELLRQLLGQKVFNELSDGYRLIFAPYTFALVGCWFIADTYIFRLVEEGE